MRLTPATPPSTHEPASGPQAWPIVVRPPCGHPRKNQPARPSRRSRDRRGAGRRLQRGTRHGGSASTREPWRKGGTPRGRRDPLGERLLDHQPGNLAWIIATKAPSGTLSITCERSRWQRPCDRGSATLRQSQGRSLAEPPSWSCTRDFCPALLRGNPHGGALGEGRYVAVDNLLRAVNRHPRDIAGGCR